MPPLLLFGQEPQRRWIVQYEATHPAVKAARLMSARGLGLRHGSLQDIMGQAGVIHYEPDQQVQGLLTPDDPQYALQWHLSNVGQSGGNPEADIKSRLGWEMQQDGGGAIMGIIDSGVDWQHPDLVDNIWQNLGEDADGDGRVLEWNGSTWIFDPGDQNGVDDDGNGYTDDFIGWDFVNNDNDPGDDHVFGHGTHVAGIAGARGNNSEGVTGVAWQAQLMPLKFLNASGTGWLSDAIEALNYAVNMGARISNHSWGGALSSQAFQMAVQQAAQNNHVLVAAAGNNFGNNNDEAPLYPASYGFENIISVGATNEFDSLARFSNVGPMSVDLFAPGRGILSTLPEGNYGYLSGTSMAAPMISGALALLLTKEPQLGSNAIKQRLLRTTRPIEALRGKGLSGGILDLFRLLNRPIQFQKNVSYAADHIVKGTGNHWILAGQMGNGAWVQAFSGSQQQAWSWSQANTQIHTLAQIGTATWAVGDYQGQPWWGQFDAVGQLSGATQLNSPVPATANMILENENGIYLGGYQVQGDTSIWLAHLDTSGQLGWRQEYGLPGEDWQGVDLVSGEEDALFLLLQGTNRIALLELDEQGEVERSNLFTKNGETDLRAGVLTGGADEEVIWITGSFEHNDGRRSAYAWRLEPGEGLDAAWELPLGFAAKAVEARSLPNGNLLMATSWDLGASEGLQLVELTDEMQVRTHQAYDWADLELEPVSMALQQPANLGLLARNANGETRWLLAQLGIPALCQGVSSSPAPVQNQWPLVQSVSFQTNSLNWSLQNSAGPAATVPTGETLICDNSNCQVQAYFSLPEVVLCEEAVINPLNESQQATSYQWIYNGMLLSTQANPSLQLPEDDGLIPLSLVAMDGGFIDTFSLLLTIEPEWTIPSLDTTHCGPAVVLAGPDGPQSYSWRDDNGTEIGTGQYIRLTTSGQYELEISDACGETSNASFDVNLQPGCIWPGDVNADGTVDMLDFLVLGMAANATGPTRPGANTSFTPQTAPNWPQSFPADHPWAPNLNYAHADADGNGVIDIQADGAVIRQNFSEGTLPRNTDSTAVELTLDIPQPVIELGDTLNFDIHMGTRNQQPIDQAFGLALTLDYNLPLPDPAVLTPYPSWMGSSSELDTLSVQQPGKRKIHTGQVRNDLTGINGSGRSIGGGVVVVIEEIGNVSANTVQSFLSFGVNEALLVQPNGERIFIHDQNAQASQTVVVNLPRLEMDLRLWLQGAYDSHSQQMRHQLADQQIIPLQSPYNADPVQAATIPPTAVDWILVELLDEADSSVMASHSLLLMASGHALDPKTLQEPVWREPDGNYRLRIRHRNHKAVLSNLIHLKRDSENHIVLHPDQFDVEVLAPLGDGQYGLWAGDLDQNGLVQYSGAGNDRRLILQRLNGELQGTLTGYWPEDANLDGLVDYLGERSDRAQILKAVGADLPTRIR
ncbi:MAG: S8 family peptidase [Bacteroidota bacterium]